MVSATRPRIAEAGAVSVLGRICRLVFADMPGCTSIRDRSQINLKTGVGTTDFADNTDKPENIS